MCFFLNWLAILTHGCAESNERAPPGRHLACLQLLHQEILLLECAGTTESVIDVLTHDFEAPIIRSPPDIQARSELNSYGAETKQD